MELDQEFCQICGVESCKGGDQCDFNECDLCGYVVLKGTFKSVCPGELHRHPIKIQLLSETASLPRKTKEKAVCWDVYSNKNMIISALGVGVVDLGFRIELPEGFEARIRPRSGLATKGVFCILGTIDEDYRGEVSAIIANMDHKAFFIKIGDRIAQISFHRVEPCLLSVVPEISTNTERGEDGYGSTGVRDDQ